MQEYFHFASSKQITSTNFTIVHGMMPEHFIDAFFKISEQGIEKGIE